MLQHEMRAIAVALAALGLAACGGGGGGGSSAPVDNGPVVVVPAPPVNGPAWNGYGMDAQHSSLAQVATQPLKRVVWQTPSDLAPPYSSRGYLLVHYGSPAITRTNTVIVPVRTIGDKFKVEARAGADGALKWSFDSDYVLPPHRWTPSYNVALTPANRLYAAGAGGKVYVRDDADAANATSRTLTFYDSAVYAAHQAEMDAAVTINTPLTADNSGNIYFGFIAGAGNPAGLASGFARIAADGTGSWVSAAAVSGDPGISKPATNAAPAVTPDGKTVYVLANDPVTGAGALVALDAATLARRARASLVDPASGTPAYISDDGTASPTIGPDGAVFIGVLEADGGAHNQRGWLLHFDATLAHGLIPGSFGWDDTPSIVPAAMVPGYKGSSTYLVMTKYNNYQRSGSGDGQNKVAVLDPNASQNDPVPQTATVQVMKEVLTILGPTPDPGNPAGVTEWCVNIAAVDPFTKSILVNSEDGYLYRWDMATNSLTEKVRLTSGLGESYTPTAVGPDGKVYAINNAVLFAVGQ
jgi:hypothetical protein